MLVTGKNFRANNGLRVTIGPVEPSDDTPSVSHSLDSSLREGAGIGAVPFIVPLGKRKVAGDFHRPYENSEYFTGFCRGSDTGWGRALTV